jgi:hypothetical protein
MYLLVDTFISHRFADNAAAFAAQASATQTEAARIILSAAPEVHVRIDGKPRYLDIDGTSLARIVNTGFLILRDRTGKHYLKISDSWMTAASLHGSWTLAASVPPDCDKVATDEKISDLLMGGDVPDLPPRPSPRRGVVPHIYIDVTPVEARPSA